MRRFKTVKELLDTDLETYLVEMTRREVEFLVGLAADYVRRNRRPNHTPGYFETAQSLFKIAGGKGLIGEGDIEIWKEIDDGQD